VTGPTGVVGGHEVRALAHRTDERSDRLAAAGAQVVVGDLLDLWVGKHDYSSRRSAVPVAVLTPSRPENETAGNERD
jgi:dienelactone hydrolase